MIHIKANPSSTLYKSPDRSAQILNLTDIHSTSCFQTALPVIISPTQRTSKTGSLAQGKIIFQTVLPWFYSGKILTKLQIWHEFHFHFFCFLSVYVVLILPVPGYFMFIFLTDASLFFIQNHVFTLQPVLFQLHFPQHPSVPEFLHGVHPKVTLCCICNTLRSRFHVGKRYCKHYC